MDETRRWSRMWRFYPTVATFSKIMTLRILKQRVCFSLWTNRQSFPQVQVRQSRDPPWWSDSCLAWRSVRRRCRAPGCGSWGWRSSALQSGYWGRTLERRAGLCTAALLSPHNINTCSYILPSTHHHHIHACEHTRRTWQPHTSTESDTVQSCILKWRNQEEPVSQNIHSLPAYSCSRT